MKHVGIRALVGVPVLIGVGLLISCKQSESGEDLQAEPMAATRPAASADLPTVSFDNPIPVEQVLASPDGFIGKEVTIRGTMTERCTVSGCWCRIGDEQQQVLVKVSDMKLAPLPGRVGQEVLAHGRLEDDEGQVVLMTDGVKAL
jgi:hypothetical protein